MKVFGLFQRNQGLLFIVGFLSLSGIGFSNQAEPLELYLPFPEDLRSIEDNQTSVIKNLDSQNQLNSNTKENSSKEQDLNTKTVSPSEIVKDPKTKPPTKKKKEKLDPSLGSFQKGKSYLTRNQKSKAETEFSESANKEGGKSNQAKIENTNLFSLDGKDQESIGIVEKMEDPDAKIKAQFEMARSLDRMGKPDSEEKAYKEYLKLINDFPKHATLTPKSHYAIAVLLLRKKEFKPAAYHLVTILKEYKDADEFLPSHYQLGRLYESPWLERDLERSKKYYEIYLRESEGKITNPGLDFRRETKERLKMMDYPI
ncbi:MAG: tetratricopeptide repeat protein [Leptospira sp.]|nr:tetratricopeptide repeat protein [Leptospira sp.]